MSVADRDNVAEPLTSRTIIQHLGRAPSEAVCDPCIATATGIPLTTVARATAQLIQEGGHSGWTGTCPRCGELRPVVRVRALWRPGPAVR